MKDSCLNLKPFGAVFLRTGLGVIFIYHGWGKVFGPGTVLGSHWNPHGMSACLQAMVSWGELLGGLAILIGFLARIASLGIIIIIMTGAIITVHGANGFNMMNQSYEYNFALIAMCLALIATGAGPFSMDQTCCCNDA